MKKIRVGVAGYGTIGQRLADGVAMQEDMELVGVADLAPTLAVRALYEKGIPHPSRHNKQLTRTYWPYTEAPNNTVWYFGINTVRSSRII